MAFTSLTISIHNGCQAGYTGRPSSYLAPPTISNRIEDHLLSHFVCSDSSELFGANVFWHSAADRETHLNALHDILVNRGSHFDLILSLSSSIHHLPSLLLVDEPDFFSPTLLFDCLIYMMAEEVKVDKQVFHDRLGQLISAWKADRRSGDALFGGVGSMVILLGKAEESLGFQKANALHVRQYRAPGDSCVVANALVVTVLASRI